MQQLTVQLEEQTQKFITFKVTVGTRMAEVRFPNRGQLPPDWLKYSMRCNTTGVGDKKILKVIEAVYPIICK